MNRLESINQELSSMINSSSKDKLSNLCLTTCEYAINNGNLSNYQLIEEFILRLKNKTDYSSVEIEKISSLMESHDEKYFNYDDEGKSDEAMSEFIKARGFASLYYGAQYHNTSNKEILQECIYEASMIQEDSSDLFILLKDIL